MHALRHELPVTIEEDGVVIREIEWGDFHIGHETYETAFDVAPAEGVTGRYVPVPALGTASGAGCASATRIGKRLPRRAMSTTCHRDTHR